MRASITDLLEGTFDRQGNLFPPGQQDGAKPVRPQRRNALTATEEAELSAAAPAQDMARIAELRRDGDTQPRGGLNEDRVKEYMEAKREGIILPAVKICFDGKDKWLWDGFHRVEAHLRLGLEEIAVSIQRGTMLDAQWLSCAANKEHGLNRTQEDKERAVRKALRHPNGATKSNRDIARHVGVDEKTVRKYRAEMESTAEIPQLANREVQRGDLRYQLPTGKIGKTPAAEPSYKPVYQLEGLVREWLKGYQSPQHGDDQVALLRATRHANSPSRPELEKWLKERVRWRRPDLTQAIDNVRSQLEAVQRNPALAQRASRYTLPTSGYPFVAREAPVATPAPPLPHPEEAPAPRPSDPYQGRGQREGTETPAPLKHSERVEAIRTELVYWQGALLHLALVGDLTGQHSSVLALRREIEKVIGLYRAQWSPEGGQG